MITTPPLDKTVAQESAANPLQPSQSAHNYPGMVFCRGCGGRVHETAVMCPHCGYTEKQPDTERCWNCREPVHVDARKCPHCGYTGDKAGKKAVPWAYISAIVLPIVGIGLGIYLLTKQRFGHGLFTIILSIVMISFWQSFWPSFWVELFKGMHHL